MKNAPALVIKRRRIFLNKSALRITACFAALALTAYGKLDYIITGYSFPGYYSRNNEVVYCALCIHDAAWKADYRLAVYI